MIWFIVLFFFFKQKTAYEMRISDWSSDVCSSDLRCCGSMPRATRARVKAPVPAPNSRHGPDDGSMPRVMAAARRELEGQMAPMVLGLARQARRKRSEERRVGEVCVSTSSSRWSPYH